MHACIHASELSSGSEDVDDDHAAMELDAVLDANILPNQPLSGLPAAMLKQQLLDEAAQSASGRGRGQRQGTEQGEPAQSAPARGRGRGRSQGVPVGQRQQEPAQAAPARGRGGGRSQGKGRSGSRGRGGRAME